MNQQFSVAAKLLSAPFQQPCQNSVSCNHGLDMAHVIRTRAKLILAIISEKRGLYYFDLRKWKSIQNSPDLPC